METANRAGKSRKRLIPLFKKLLNENSVPQLCWLNKDEGIWQMPWKYHKQTVWGDPDAFMLQELAKSMYDYTGIGEPERVTLKGWKEKIRNALTSAKNDVKELEHLHIFEGDNPYKVYQFLNVEPDCRKVTNFRRRNGETCQSSKRKAASACGISSGAKAGLQFYESTHNSTLLQATGTSCVPFYNVNQHSQSNGSAFQQYSKTSVVTAQLLSNQDPASACCPSTSCSMDNFDISSDTFLDLLSSTLCINDELIPRDVTNPYRSRSPLSNTDDAGNMGNIPLIIQNATEIENDDSVFMNTTCPSTKNMPFNLLTPNTPESEIINAGPYHVAAIRNNTCNNINGGTANTGDARLFNNCIRFSHAEQFVGNFEPYERNCVTHEGNFIPIELSGKSHERNFASYEGNFVPQDRNFVGHPATYIDSTTVANDTHGVTNSASAFTQRDDALSVISIPRDSPVRAPPEFNMGDCLNLDRILHTAPRNSLVVIAYYFLRHPVKYQILTGKFRICFVPDDQTRESMKCSLDPQQFGPNDVDMFELPEVNGLSKLTQDSRDTQKVLNNLTRGVIIDCRGQDVYATRYCKAVPHFCIPDATQFQKMERHQEVKIFDFQSNYSSGLDPNFECLKSKPCVRLSFAVKDANKKESVLNVDIWHKEAYQMSQGVAEHPTSMEPDCSMSDEYDNRLEIEQDLKKIQISLYTTRIQL